MDERIERKRISLICDPGLCDTFWVTKPTRCRVYATRYRRNSESYLEGFRIQLSAIADSVDFCFDLIDKEPSIELYSSMVDFIENQGKNTMIIKLSDVRYTEYNTNQLYKTVEYSIE